MYHWPSQWFYYTKSRGLPCSRPRACRAWLSAPAPAGRRCRCGGGTPVSYTHLKDENGNYKAPEYESYTENETLNSMVPLWKRDKKKVTDEEYADFYKQKFGDYAAVSYTHLDVYKRQL